MYETEAFKSLGSFPLVQAALALLIVLGGVVALMRGNRERGSASGNGAIPPYLMMGPAHDAMVSMHAIAEQSRRQNDLLERQLHLLEKIADEERLTNSLLEMIRNESRLR